MRVLLLNLYYPPDTSATAKIAAAFAEALTGEHDVTVLCGRPSYNPTDRRPWRLWKTERQGRIAVIRVGSTAFPRFRMKQRLLNYLTYVALAVPRALVVRCDIVLAMTDPPFEGIVGAFVSLLKRRPLIYNIQDLYPEMAVAGGLIRPGWLARLWERIHRWALGRAGRVIVLGEDMRERILEKGVPASRIAVVRDGAETSASDRTQSPLDAGVMETIRGNYRFVVVHAGNLGFYGAWETLITAARELESEGVGLVFVGEGAEKARVEAAAEGCAAVRILPFFPAAKIPAVLAAADIHIITVKRGLEGVVVPSKLYEILAAGKPILVVAPLESEAARVALTRGCGVACDPEQPLVLAAYLRELAHDPERVRQMSARARALAPEFDRSKQLANLTRIIEEVIQK
jgi:colanic acid biosynthesis glycosyl transferase WcaI